MGEGKSLAEATDSELTKELGRRLLERGESTRYIFDGLGQRFQVTYLSIYGNGKRQYTVDEAPFEDGE